MFKKKVKLVTHDGAFHGDDVFATAFLELMYEAQGRKTKVIRTRDLDIVKTGDVVYDVGLEYDPNNMRFDHHQTEGAGERDNGVPYSAFGLIWKHFGRELCSSDGVWKKIDEDFVQHVCAEDVLCFDFKYKDIDWRAWTFDRYVDLFVDFSDEDNESFKRVVKVAKDILIKIINKYEKKVLDNKAVEEIYENAEDKRIIVLDEGRSWSEVLTQKEEPLYVVYPNHNGSVKVRAIPNVQGGKDPKKPFPQEWAGKVDGELIDISGVKTAQFCHRNRHLCGSQTKEDAIRMAKISADL